MKYDLRGICGCLISSPWSLLKEPLLEHWTFLQNPVGPILHSWSLLKAPCLNQRPSLQSPGGQISSSWPFLKAPCLSWGPSLRHWRVVLSMSAFQFCSSMQLNSALFRIISVPMRKSRVTLCLHATTEMKAVAMQTTRLDTLTILSCRQRTAMVPSMTSTSRAAKISEVPMASLTYILSFQW